MNPAPTPFLALSGHAFSIPEEEAPARLRSGRMALGMQAAAEGDLNVAIFAFVRAANDFRLNGQPTFEAFALVELAAIFRSGSTACPRSPEGRRRSRRTERSPLRLELVHQRRSVGNRRAPAPAEEEPLEFSALRWDEGA